VASGASRGRESAGTGTAAAVPAASSLQMQTGGFDPPGEYCRSRPAGSRPGEYCRSRPAGSRPGLLDGVAGFTAFCGTNDATAFGAAFGFLGKFGFGLGTLDHGRFS
jgi:hypothetical protein